MHFHHFRLKKHVLPQLQTKERKKTLNSTPTRKIRWEGIYHLKEIHLFDLHSNHETTSIPSPRAKAAKGPDQCQVWDRGGLQGVPHC